MSMTMTDGGVYSRSQREMRGLILGEVPGWARASVEEHAKTSRREVGESVADLVLLERAVRRFQHWWSIPTGPAAAWLADSGRDPETVFAKAIELSNRYGHVGVNQAVAFALEELIFGAVLTPQARGEMGHAHPMHPRY